MYDQKSPQKCAKVSLNCAKKWVKIMTELAAHKIVWTGIVPEWVGWGRGGSLLFEDLCSTGAKEKEKKPDFYFFYNSFEIESGPTRTQVRLHKTRPIPTNLTIFVPEIVSQFIIDSSFRGQVDDHVFALNEQLLHFHLFHEWYLHNRKGCFVLEL